MDHSAIEWLDRRGLPRRFRAAIFDFDGTLSLLREDWPAIMTEQMKQELGPGNDAIIHEIVYGLNGKPTIHQMRRLVEEKAKGGGMPKTAEEYKQDYWDILLARVAGRLAKRMDWLVPGIGELLAELQSRGIELHLVTGSDHAHVTRELKCLGLHGFFPDGAHAPRGNDGFLKRDAARGIMAAWKPDEVIGFGDGAVETEDLRHLGGYAVGVATRWEKDGRMHEVKRERLIASGAQALIPDYARHADWIDQLFAR